MEFPISRVLFTRRMGLSSTSCAFNYQNVIPHRGKGLEVNIRYVETLNAEAYFCRNCVLLQGKEIYNSSLKIDLRMSK